MDSNHRRHSRQIYSLLPLAARATLRHRKEIRYGFRALGRFVVSSWTGFTNKNELTRGLEPLTTCLQNRCSTVELRQPFTTDNPPLRGREYYFSAKHYASKVRTCLASSQGNFCVR